MKILVACEESQEVCKAFRAKGHEAYSCDIIEPSGGHPEWHILGDVLPILNPPNISLLSYPPKPMPISFNTMDGEYHEVERWDMIIAFPPCFEAGTKVLTYEGYKNIEDIKVGDLVLTHKGRYKKVINIMAKPANTICRVKAENSGDIYCTPNHPFYTTTMKRKFNSSRRRYDKTFEEFKWTPPIDFYTLRNSSGPREQTYVVNITDDIEEIPTYEGYLKNFNSFTQKVVNTLPLDGTGFWYMVGRWVGDGWFYYKKETLYGIKICCSKKETEELQTKLQQCGYRFSLSHENTTDKFEIDNVELANFLFNNFGKGAEGKRIPGFVTRLPKHLAISFLTGYFDADGSYSSNRIAYDSISENLIYGIKYMVNKYYKVGCGITFNDNTNRQVIQGRQVNAKNSYTGTFHPNKTSHTHYVNYSDNIILSQYLSVEQFEKNTIVYNLSVEEDESYTVNGLVVHNCTDLTVTGARVFERKRADGSQGRSIEFFAQFLTANCDKIAIENPVGIISGEYIKKWFPDLCKKYNLPRPYSQIVHPWMFGASYSKKTCLWLKGLPELKPDVEEEPEQEWVEWVDKKTGKTKRQNKWYYECSCLPTKDRAKARSKTYPGFAKAMAEQWG